MQLNTDDLIKLAENGKITETYWWDNYEQRYFPIEIELDDMAKAVLHECLYMLNFEKKYYERERKREQKKQKA
ncbi:MAG: hypothetical protein IAA89_02315 [Firmicutes bacterium]|uniref:Uncharacterized protein n=1 Tax=Candidatus Gallilactobacillus intestinavium TaxID=2840838 RepID=A0A9D9E6S2_9LACO|nr:hypothetical protein [Candidatus Gallilactobacillus intestinavium]